MLGFNHALSGSIIGVLVPAPFVPFVAVCAHFVLDTTPHYGASETVYPYTKSFKALLITDGVLCIASTLFAMLLFPDKWFIIGIGALFSTLPDTLWLFLNRGPKWLDKFLGYAQLIQWGERPYGWIFDAFYGMVMCITLYLLSR
jgi:hypothetical protein